MNTYKVIFNLGLFSVAYDSWAKRIDYILGSLHLGSGDRYFQFGNATNLYHFDVQSGVTKIRVTDGSIMWQLKRNGLRLEWFKHDEA